MKKFLKYENNAIIKIGIFLMLFLSWLFPYVLKDKGEVIGISLQILLILSGALFLILFKNTIYILEILLFFPFTFAHTMDLYTIPIYLYLSIGILIISFIIHLIIYKPKLKIPSFFLGFLLIAIALVLGGLGVKLESWFLKTLLLFFIGASFLFLYIFLANTVKISFKDLAILMSFLGLFLIMQVFVNGLLNPDIIKDKLIDLGWASNSNSLAMILLFTFPFMAYLVFSLKGIKRILFGALGVIQILTLIISYSRGAIFAGFISYLILAILMIIKKDRRKVTCIYLGIIFSVLILLGLAFYFFNHEIFIDLVKNIFKINLDDLNGRKPIYDALIAGYFERPIFGYGIYHSYNDAVLGGYLWGHNTFIQTAYTLGTIGLIGIIYHHVEKYMFCFRNYKLEKLFILISFLATDLYGMVDVSYFFINFMLVLLVILISIENIFKVGEINE